MLGNRTNAACVAFSLGVMCVSMFSPSNEQELRFCNIITTVLYLVCLTTKRS